MSSETFESTKAKIGKLDAETTNKIARAMAEEAASPKSQQDLESAIQAMTGKAVKISKQFEEVRLQLLIADGKNYQDKNGKVIEKMAPGWELLQNRFDDLLQTSQDAASTSVAYINTYINNIVPMMDDKRYTVEDRKAELKAFIGQAESADGEDPTHKKAVEMKKDFTKLSRDVSGFAIKFVEYAKQQKEVWNDRIDVLETDITNLNITIGVLDKKIMALGIALGVGAHVFAIGACSAILAMGPFGPLVAGAIVLVGLIVSGVEIGYLTDAIIERNKAESDKKSKQTEINDKKASIKELEAIQANLTSSKVVVDDIAVGILGFADIWTHVAADAKELSAAVEFGIKAASVPGLVDRVALTVAGYTTLAKALGKYARMIQDEKNKPADK